MKNGASIFILILLSSAAQAQTAKRSRALDFEETLVEGVNRKPLDSLNQLNDDLDATDKRRLYRKRSGFRIEMKNGLDDMRYVQ